MTKKDSEAAAGCGLLIFGAIVLAMVVGWLAGGINYSDGYREGHVQKLTRKGLIWTTYEGELATAGLKATGGKHPTTSNVFEFSVSDPSVAAELEKVHGEETVRLHYKQYLFSPPWKGSTGYFVWKVEKMQQKE